MLHPSASPAGLCSYGESSIVPRCCLHLSLVCQLQCLSLYYITLSFECSSASLGFLFNILPNSAAFVTFACLMDTCVLRLYWRYHMHMGQSFYFLPRISALIFSWFVFVFVFNSCAIVWMWFAPHGLSIGILHFSVWTVVRWWEVLRHWNSHLQKQDEMNVSCTPDNLCFSLWMNNFATWTPEFLFGEVK